jgi:hypothetical protein
MGVHGHPAALFYVAGRRGFAGNRKHHFSLKASAARVEFFALNPNGTFEPLATDCSPGSLTGRWPSSTSLAVPAVACSACCRRSENSEWAYIATQRTGVNVPQGAARTLDRNVRVDPLNSINLGSVSHARIKALVETACLLLTQGAPPVAADKIHRLDKADTKGGLSAIQSAARLGIPYPILLSSRFPP